VNPVVCQNVYQSVRIVVKNLPILNATGEVEQLGGISRFVRISVTRNLGKLNEFSFDNVPAYGIVGMGTNLLLFRNG